jgi:hypothetical protein
VQENWLTKFLLTVCSQKFANAFPPTRAWALLPQKMSLKAQLG